jgi:hypothetical protein
MAEGLELAKVACAVQSFVVEDPVDPCTRVVDMNTSAHWNFELHPTSLSLQSAEHVGAPPLSLWSFRVSCAEPNAITSIVT